MCLSLFCVCVLWCVVWNERKKNFQAEKIASDYVAPDAKESVVSHESNRLSENIAPS